jgi:hypothetical protein
MNQEERRSYSEQEAEAILRIASELSVNGPEITRTRLLETAAELGISPEAVEQAERRYAEEKQMMADRLEYIRSVKGAFVSHLTSFVIINLFLIGINFATGIHEFWAIYPLLIWGIGMAFHAFGCYRSIRNSESDEFVKWRQDRALTSVLSHVQTSSSSAASTDTRPKIVVGVHVGTRDSSLDDRR